MEENQHERNLSESEVKSIAPEYFARYKELQKFGKLPEDFQLGDSLIIRARWELNNTSKSRLVKTNTITIVRDTS